MKIFSLKWAAALVALQTMLATAAYAATPTDKMFTDTSKVTNEKMAAIQEAVRQGLLSGDPQGTFRPSATLTRQELAILLVRALKLEPVSSSSTFNDVHSKQFAAPYIEAVQKSGLLSGDGLGNFRPNDPVTREELAAVFVRAVGGAGAEGGSSILPKDQSLVSQWAAGSVNTALRLGLISTQDSKLNPRGEVKREDIASFLIDIFKTQEQTATIDSVDGDIVTINHIPYLIEGQLKKIIRSSNKDALQGAILKFNSRNRNVDELQELEIVQKGVVLDTDGLPDSSVLRISSDGVQINGNVKGTLELQDGVSNIQLNGSVTHLTVNSGNNVSIKGNGTIQVLKVANEKTKLTLNPDFKVEVLQLPKGVAVSQVIQNYNELQKQIGQVPSNPNTGTSHSGTSPSSGGGIAPTAPVTNQAPTASGISDIILNIEDQPKKINLANYFADADGDTLTFTASSSNSNVVQVETREQNGEELKVRPVSVGTATVTVKANDGHGHSKEIAFSVIVQQSTAPAINHRPMVKNGMPFLSYPVTEAAQNVSLAGAFEDEDGDALTCTATSSNTDVATVAVDGTDLKITPVNAGTATITVTVDDGKGGTVDTQFSVMITPSVTPAPVNHTPTVKTSISDVTTGTADGTKTVSLQGVFGDEDSDTLTYTATSSNTGVATVSVDGSDLKITPINAGTTTITVTADDGKGGTVDTEFTFTVTSSPRVNHDPVIQNTINDVSTEAGAEDTTIGLASIFEDEDSDSLTYTADSSDPSLASVSVTGDQLSITPHVVGTATVTVTADDGHGGKVQTTFQVTVGEKKGLFFSELAWGESDPTMQIIELYNAGSEKLDASKITIVRSDGGEPIVINPDAGAFIPSRGTFTIGDTMYFGDVPIDYFTDMGFYNDDSTPVTLSLYYDGQLIDTAVFQPHTTVARKSHTIHGTAEHYEASDWIDEGADYTDGLNSYNEAP